MEFSKLLAAIVMAKYFEWKNKTLPLRFFSVFLTKLKSF